jgi:hypothetical protein
MALLTVEGVYRNGKVELAETPAGVGEAARVLVTFLPTPSPAESEEPAEHQANDNGDQAAGVALREPENARRAALQRLVARLKQGIDFGGPPYPKREELYDRISRSSERDG